MPNSTNHGGKRAGAGRPKGSTTENKKVYKTFSVSCLDSEYETVKAKAESKGKTISRYLIEMALNSNM